MVCQNWLDLILTNSSKVMWEKCESKSHGRGPSLTPHERQEPNLEPLKPSGERQAHKEECLEGDHLEGGGERLGPLTRSMSKLRMGALGQAMDGRESNMYMLREGPLRVA